MDNSRDNKHALFGADGKLWFTRYLGFGIGAVGMDLSYGLFNAFLTKYFTDILKLNTLFLLIVPTLGRIWDGINDPMMGTIVDNTKSRLGKFRPWILVGSVLNAAVLTLLFTNPGFTTSTTTVNWGLYIYAAVMYFMWDMTNTMVDIPYWSMVPALTSDPRKRNVVASIPRLFSGGGQLIVSVFTVMLVEAFGKGNEALGYSRWAMTAGFILICGCVVTVVTTKENGSAPPAEKFTLRTAYNTVRANDQLLVFMLTALLFNTGWYLTNAMGIYYFDDVLGDKGLLAYFAAIGGAGQALGLLLLPVLSKRFTRHRVIKGAMVTTFFGYIGMAVFGGSPDRFVPFTVFGFFACVGVGCMFVSQTIMLADIVDYGEYKLHRRSESIIFSMKGFLQKLAYTVQSIIIALGLRFSAYNPDLAEQAGLTKNTISAMMFVIPPVLIVFSFLVFTKKYQLHSELAEKVTSYIFERKAKEATVQQNS